MPLQPWRHMAIIEAEADLGRQLDRTGFAADQPDQIDPVFALRHRHEIDDGGATSRRFDRRFQDHRIGAIAARTARLRIGRAETPAAVRAVTQQRSEQRRRIEARQAQPFHRAVAVDQRGAMRVADEGQILDAPLTILFDHAASLPVGRATTGFEDKPVCAPVDPGAGRKSPERTSQGLRVSPCGAARRHRVHAAGRRHARRSAEDNPGRA